MFSFNDCTQEQGSLNTTSFAATNQSDNTQILNYPAFRSIGKRFAQATLLLFASLLIVSSAIAQGSGNVSLNAYPYSQPLVGQTSTTLAYDLTVGTSNELVEDAYGYTLTGTFEDFAETPSMLEIDLAGSWMGDETEGELSVSWDYTTGEFEISFTRDGNAPLTDYGHLISITLVANPGETLPDAARMTVGGGTSLIMVDNAGFKTAFESETAVQRLTAYPNPTSGRVNLDARGFEGQWSVTNTAGRVVLQGNGAIPQSIDLEGFPQGMYIFVAQNDDQLFRSAIVKK